MAERRSAGGIIIGWVAGLFFFLILMALANWLVPKFLEGFAVDLLELLNSLLVVMILMSFLFFLGDLFYSFYFPFDLPAPLPRAVGAVLLLYFLSRILSFLDSNMAADFYFVIEPFMPFLYGFVFAVVIIGGYVAIFMRLIFGSVHKKQRWKGFDDED